MKQRAPLIRRFWTIMLFDVFWARPGWTRTHRTNWRIAPKYGLLTPVLVKWHGA